MTKHTPATQAMVVALAHRVKALEQALEAAGIEIPAVEKDVIPEGQSRIDDYVGC